MLLKPKQTKYRKYHKGRISYNIRTNQNWLSVERKLNLKDLDRTLQSQGPDMPQQGAGSQDLSAQPAVQQAAGSQGLKTERCGWNHRVLKNDYNSQENGFKYGIMALEPGRITASNIHAIELAIKRKLKSDTSSSRVTGINSSEKDSDSQKLELRIFPHIPVTKKPIEVRMGKGKGNIDYWMTRVKSGAILLEFNCSNENFGKIISKIVNSKLPIKTKFISR